MAGTDLSIFSKMISQLCRFQRSLPSAPSRPKQNRNSCSSPLVLSVGSPCAFPTVMPGTQDSAPGQTRGPAPSGTTDPSRRQCQKSKRCISRITQHTVVSAMRQQTNIVAINNLSNYNTTVIKNHNSHQNNLNTLTFQIIKILETIIQNLVGMNLHLLLLKVSV